MPDYADEAIDRGLNDIMRYDNYRDAPDHIKYEEGLLDEFGFEYQPDLRIPVDPFNWRK
jgi:hypothetical protein